MTLWVTNTSDIFEFRFKVIAHWVRNLRVRFFVFLILSYQNACYGCENTENRTWSEFFYDGRKFQRQCVNVIDTSWGRIYFLTCENFRWKFRTQCAMTLTHENMYLDVDRTVWSGVCVWFKNVLSSCRHLQHICLHLIYLISVSCCLWASKQTFLCKWLSMHLVCWHLFLIY